MQTVRAADTKDCELINRMAQEAFPFTYRHILEPDQIEYMMHWMYDPQNIYTQMTEEGHVYFVAYQDDEPAGYVSVRPDGESLYEVRKLRAEYNLDIIQLEDLEELIKRKKLQLESLRPRLEEAEAAAESVISALEAQ